MADKLDMDAINALPQPLIARFFGGSEWPVYDIEVQTGLMRIDVGGKLEVKRFSEVKILVADGEEHDADCFWND